MTAIADEAMDLVVEGLKTVIATWRIRDPARVTKLLKFAEGLQYIHKSLTVGRLRSKQLRCYIVIAACGTSALLRRISQSRRPDVEILIREIGGRYWVKSVRI